MGIQRLTMASAPKMKRSLRNSFCSGIESVATFNSNNCRPPLYTPFSDVNHLRERSRAERRDPVLAHDEISGTTPSLISSHYEDSILTKGISEDDLSPPPSLEEMLARLDEEEEEEHLLTGYLPYDYCEGLRGTVPSLLGCSYNHHLQGFSCYNDDINPRRMSCVNNSEILRAARQALNQYPRFSVDGRDQALRGPSVQGGGRGRMDLPRKSFCGEQEMFMGSDLGRKLGYDRHPAEPKGAQIARITDKENGSCNSKGKLLTNNQSSSNVRWREPGLIARLMGLEAMPMNSSATSSSGSDRPTVQQKACTLPKSGTNASTFKDSGSPVKPDAKEQPRLDPRRSMVPQPKAVNSKQDHSKQSKLPGSVSKQQGLTHRQKPYDHVSRDVRPFSGAGKTVKSKDESHGVQRKLVGLQVSSSADNQSRKQQRSCCKASDSMKSKSNEDEKDRRRLRNGAMRKHVV